MGFGDGIVRRCLMQSKAVAEKSKPLVHSMSAGAKGGG